MDRLKSQLTLLSPGSFLSLVDTIPDAGTIFLSVFFNVLKCMHRAKHNFIANQLFFKAEVRNDGPFMTCGTSTLSPEWKANSIGAKVKVLARDCESACLLNMEDN